MAGSRKVKPIAVRRPVDPERARRLRKFALHFTCAAVLLSFWVVTFRFLGQYVDKRLTFATTSPRIVLKNRPAWMSDLLAEQLVRSVRPSGAHSSFDHSLLVERARILERSPWVRRVISVRRTYTERPGDTIEIDCEFRTPVALVRWMDYYWLVDVEGYKLPEQYAATQVPRIIRGPDGRTQIRVIDGVKNPPVESGQRWPGDDLRAGLDLAKLIYNKPFTDEISKIDVTNFGGRVDPREAQLTLGTVNGTQIRWGRPVNARDYFVEVSPARKLQNLEQIRNEYGRIDGGHAWIDIRFDRITYPSGGPAQVNSGQ